MRDIANALRYSGKVGSDDLNTALDLFGETEDLWKNLVSQGLISEEDVFRAVAEYSGLEYVDLTGITLEAQVLALVPANFCRKEKVLPIGQRGDHLFLAISDPSNIIAIDDVASLSGLIVAPKIVAPGILQQALDRYLRSDEELSQLSAELGVEAAEEAENEDITADDDDAPIVRFVNLLISQAIQDRASDIHVEPGAKELKVRFRIDGVLHEMQKADRAIQAGILSRLKIMADIDIAEKRKPQDGRMSVQHQGKQIDIRVASLPTVWGEKIVMRILDHDTTKRSLDSIGMSDHNLDIFRRAIAKPHGMVLVTGPTGSGKSTTLYTTLDEVANPSVNVITVEDPVEKRIEGVNQVQVNNKAGMTFPAALKSILRSDPDIVLLGEIRDKETATIAVEASLTGHLVLSTLHTNGAPDALPRLVEMGVEPYLVSTAVSCVVAQRLARRLCEKCKAVAEPDEALETLMERVAFAKDGDKWPEVHKAVGCSTCSGTGYRGRLAILEVMAVSETIERLTVEHAPSSQLRAAANEEGLVSLRDDGWRLVRAGLTTIEEILRVTA